MKYGPHRWFCRNSHGGRTVWYPVYARDGLAILVEFTEADARAAAQA